VASLITVQLTDADDRPLQGATVQERNTPTSGTATVDERKEAIPVEADGTVSDIVSFGQRYKEKQEFVDDGKPLTEQEAVEGLKTFTNETVSNKSSEQTLTVTTNDKRKFEVTYTRTITNQSDGKFITEKNKNGLNVVVLYSEPKVKEIKE
jgi:hypothetical protein